MERNGPKIVIFPPLVAVATPALAALLEWLLPLNLLPKVGNAIILQPGLLVLAVAGWLAISGVRAFKRGGTNVDPRQPALVLVRDGPYRFTRNPMYLGMVVLQIGLGLAFSLDWAMFLAPAVLLILHFGVVLKEEAYLLELFGDPYRAYLKETQRWL